jgi:hypothetical protein
MISRSLHPPPVHWETYVTASYRWNKLLTFLIESWDNFHTFLASFTFHTSSVYHVQLYFRSFSEGNCCLDGHEVFFLSWYPKGWYSFPKSTPLGPVLRLTDQCTPTHTHYFYFYPPIYIFVTEAVLSLKPFPTKLLRVKWSHIRGLNSISQNRKL